ncbi:ABC transporter permease subunit [Plantactinospora sp. GCM10030261]|uniref:ABC transporter permease subunit n=1 Tax=Plantactinospora sp. GCM10030261 TaxID=3273420 RepID=UPI00360E9FE0
MSLYRTELRRLAKRRLTRLMLALLFVGLATIVVSISVASQKIGPDQLAAAEVRAEANYREAVGYHEQSIRDCEAAKERGEDMNRFPPDCGKEFSPRREDFQAEWFLPYQFEFREDFGIFVSVFAGITALIAFIVGASYVGAEWNSGGMMNLLLWRPKRLSVLFTKLAALLTGALGVTVLLGALWTVAFWLIGRYDGITGKLTTGVWKSIGLTGVRGAAMVLIVAAIAFGLASLGRHTAMALGVVVAVGVVSEIGVRVAMAVAGVPFGDRYVLSSYALAWFNKQYTLFNYESCNFAVSGECRPAELVLTWQQSGVLFGIATVLVLGGALWTMRRRDVT